MKKNSIATNYLYHVISQMVILLVPLLTTPYLSRVIGPGGIGAYSFISSIAAWFVMFAAPGMSRYGQREISYVQDSREGRTRVFWETKLLTCVTSAISLALFILLLVWKQRPAIWYLFCFEIAAVAFDIIWFFQGMEAFHMIAQRNIGVRLMSMAFIFLFVRDQNDLPVYIAGMIFFPALGNALMWTKLPAYISRQRVRASHMWKHVPVAASLFIPEIAISVYSLLDKTMIGLYADHYAENGYYEQALKISKLVVTLVTSLGAVVISRIGYLYERRRYQEVNSLIYRSCRFVWMIGIPACCGLIMVAPVVIPWFLGPGYDRVIVLLRILALMIPAMGMSNVTGVQYLIPTKRQKVFTITVITGAVCNCVLNVLSIPYLGAVGAAASSVVTEAVVAAAQLFYLRKELSVIKILSLSKNYCMASFVMCLSLAFLTRYMTPCALHTVILVISGGAVYLSVLLLEKDDFCVGYLVRGFWKVRHVLSDIRNKYK